jgi:hypothetical protein
LCRQQDKYEGHDLLCKACIDRGLLYSAKARIFNNMLYVLYVHLTRRSIFIRDKPILSSERMLNKDYDPKGSVAKKKKTLVMSPKGLGAKKN